MEKIEPKAYTITVGDNIKGHGIVTKIEEEKYNLGREKYFRITFEDGHMGNWEWDDKITPPKDRLNKGGKKKRSNKSNKKYKNKKNKSITNRRKSNRSH